MNVKELPNDFYLLKKINLTEEKGLFILINLFSLGLAMVTFFVGIILMPINIFSISIKTLFICNGVFIVSMIVYIILHEWIHGVFIKRFSGEKAHYGFKSGCAYAGSDYFFNKKSYIIIALSPIIIWGILLGILCLIVPQPYSWLVYLVEVINISGGAGDLYVTYIISKMPKETLVEDTGTSMSFFAKTLNK